MRPISYSQARLFSDCPARFKAERIDGMVVEPSIPIKVGVFVHSAVETYGREKMAQLEKQGYPVESAASIANRLWDRRDHGLPDFMREECIGLVERTAESLPIEWRSVVGVEVKLAVDESGEYVQYDSPSAAVRGRLDRLEVGVDESGNPILTAWDLKSGRMIEDPAQSRQLALYCSMAAVTVRETNARGQLYYPRYGVLREARITERMQADALAWALRCRQAIFDRARQDSWPETPGRACADCPVFGRCHARESARLPAQLDDEEGAAKLLGDISILTRELSEKKQLLKDWVERNGAIDAGGLSADLGLVHRYKWRVRQLADLLTSCGLEPLRFLTADTKRLKSESLKNTELARGLAAVMEDRTSVKLSIRDSGVDKKIEEDHQHED